MNIQLPFYCIDIKDFIYYRFQENNNILKFNLRHLVKYNTPYKIDSEHEFKSYIKDFLKNKYIKELTFEEFKNCIDYAIDFIINNEADPRFPITPEEIKTNKAMLNKNDNWYNILTPEINEI